MTASGLENIPTSPVEEYLELTYSGINGRGTVTISSKEPAIDFQHLVTSYSDPSYELHYITNGTEIELTVQYTESEVIENLGTIPDVASGDTILVIIDGFAEAITEPEQASDEIRKMLTDAVMEAIPPILAKYPDWTFGEASIAGEYVYSENKEIDLGMLLPKIGYGVIAQVPYTTDDGQELISYFYAFAEEVGTDGGYKEGSIVTSTPETVFHGYLYNLPGGDYREYPGAGSIQDLVEPVGNTTYGMNSSIKIY